MIVFRYQAKGENFGSLHNNDGYKGRLSIDGVKDMEFSGDTKDLLAMYDVLQAEIEKRMDLE